MCKRVFPAEKKEKKEKKEMTARLSNNALVVLGGIFGGRDLRRKPWDCIDMRGKMRMISRNCLFLSRRRRHACEGTELTSEDVSANAKKK